MNDVKEGILCFHCGDDCPDETTVTNGKYFCCEGCKIVYEILQENNLCTFYTLNDNPGSKQNTIVTSSRFSFLDEPSIRQKLISFKNNQSTYITFQIPGMHCSSCIWLLENIKRINNGVVSSRVDFLKKELSIVYDESVTSLRVIVEQLANVGYEPSIHLDSLDSKRDKTTDKGRIYRIGVAGFCLGNIMMLSFPEYFSGGVIIEPGLKTFFSYVILFLSLPVFFFCSSEFFVNAWNSMKQKSINIDVPIALGIAAMFIRSSYEIISQTGPGYMDSMSGLVFFMLVGRKFQDFTFDSLSFDRNYKSYFPVAVSSIKNGIEKTIPVNYLKVNDKYLVRNNEIIPVDSILLKGNAKIDYSFVTGEATPVNVKTGEMIFAGGKQVGGIIDLQVMKEVSQSHLTRLWNGQISKGDADRFQNYMNLFSRWFIRLTLIIATIAGMFWISTDIHKSLNAFTAVLIIACPCAFALSAPFTFGNIIRLLGKNKIYLKNNQVIGKLSEIDTIVFDKTGTLTVNNKSNLVYNGEKLSPDQEQLIYSLSRQSSHPLSQRLSSIFKNIQILPVYDFKEYPGLGISGIINGIEIKAGKALFTGKNWDLENDSSFASKVYVSIDGEVKGYFAFENEYRPMMKKFIGKLESLNYKLCVLSGDNDSEENNLMKIFGAKAELLFNQTPEDKLVYIKSLQAKGRKVLMIGDGLNDAGALLQSEAGFSISDDINNFTPASDGIIDASQFNNVPALLQFSRTAIHIITCSFIISLIYNFIGLSFAVKGTLSPVIAAVLMPISTISLVLFTVTASTLFAKYYSFKITDINHVVK